LPPVISYHTCLRCDTDVGLHSYAPVKYSYSLTHSHCSLYAHRKIAALCSILRLFPRVIRRSVYGRPTR